MNSNVWLRFSNCYPRGRLLAVLFPLFMGALALPVETEAVGPWKGQIVDKETGKPLEGVVVLAVWSKCGFIIMDGCAAYYDSEEVVTGSDGRFEIQPRRFSFFSPPTRGPRFHIFKPSYGRWKFKGQDAWSEDGVIRTEQEKEARKQFESKEGVVLEVTSLKTRKERLKFLTGLPGEVPKERVKRYLAALDQERINLGLPPAYSK
jgi:hypothetical protein